MEKLTKEALVHEDNIEEFKKQFQPISGVTPIKITSIEKQKNKYLVTYEYYGIN